MRTKNPLHDMQIYVERGGTFSAAVGLGQSRIDDERVRSPSSDAPCSRAWPLCRRLCGTAGHRGGGRAMRIVPALSPWKSRSVLRPPRRRRPLPEGGLRPAFGTKLFMLAQASISVPSTEKCSLDSWLRTCGRLRTLAKNLAAISPSSSRSRFLQKTVASHTGSSSRAQRTSGTTDCSQAVPSIAVPIAPCRTPVAVALATVAPAGSTAVPRAHRAGRTPATTSAAPCQPVRGSSARDDPPECVSPGAHS